MTYRVLSPVQSTLEFLSILQAFRESVYTLDSVSIDGLDDYIAWHITAEHEGRIVGSLRYVPGYPDVNGRPTASVGGWAVHPDFQMSGVAVKLLFVAFALGQKLGGAVVDASATIRHRSAAILEKVGGIPVRHYYDQHYKSDMTNFQFDTLNVAKKFSKLLTFGESVVAIGMPPDYI